VSAPNRTRLIGLLIGTGLALLAALGPLVSAITITVGVETQVGVAAGLPDARMLPAALEGVGAVALIFLLTRRPDGALRAWCGALILVSLGAGMAAQGAHAVWFDERTQVLHLPWTVRLLVSFVPPVSGLATLHLVVKMAEDLLANVRLLADSHGEKENVRASVLELVSENPAATWRVVRERTGLSDANAKRALTAARRALRNGC
jgi:hypothetical protein